MSLCECDCQLELKDMGIQLEKLSEENKSIQKALLEIRLIVENLTIEKKQYWKDEAIRQRERTWN